MIVSIKTNLQKQDCIWSTKTSISQVERDRAIDNFLNENDDKKNKNKFHHPTFENSSIDLSTHSESCEDFHIAASERRNTIDIQNLIAGKKETENACKVTH